MGRPPPLSPPALSQNRRRQCPGQNRRSAAFHALFTFRGDRRNLLYKAEQDASCPASQAAPILPPLLPNHE